MCAPRGIFTSEKRELSKYSLPKKECVEAKVNSQAAKEKSKKNIN